MWEVEKRFRIRLGGTLFIDANPLISVGGVELFTVRRRDSDGLLGVDCDLYDPAGKKVATMRHGNIVSGDSDNYQITLQPHHYSVVDKSTGRTICELKRKEAAVGAEIDLSVDLFTSTGFRLRATPHSITLPGNNKLFGGTSVGSGIEIV